MRKDEDSLNSFDYSNSSTESYSSTERTQDSDTESTRKPVERFARDVSIKLERQDSFIENNFARGFYSAEKYFAYESSRSPERVRRILFKRNDLSKLKQSDHLSEDSLTHGIHILEKSSEDSDYPLTSTPVGSRSVRVCLCNNNGTIETECEESFTENTSASSSEDMYRGHDESFSSSKIDEQDTDNESEASSIYSLTGSAEGCYQRHDKTMSFSSATEQTLWNADRSTSSIYQEPESTDASTSQSPPNSSNRKRKLYDQ